MTARPSDSAPHRAEGESAAPERAMSESAVRATAIDAVRVLGIVAVLVGHVWDTTFVERLLYPWHVPVFFFLTGYLWKSGRRLSREWQSRSRSLLVPYVAWLVIICVAFFGSLALTSGSINVTGIAKTVYGGSFATRPFSAFWFVTALLFATVAVRALEKVGRGAAWFVAIAGLIACAVAGDKVAQAPLAIGIAVPCMIFILIGAWFRQIRPRIKHQLVVAFGLLAVGFGLVFTGISPPLDLKYGNFGLPVVGVVVAMMISAGLLLVFEAALKGLDGAPALVITRLAQAGLVVVLTHAVVLWVLKTPPSGSVIALTACLVLPWLLGLAIIYSRLSPLLAGQPKVKTARTTSEQTQI